MEEDIEKMAAQMGDLGDMGKGDDGSMNAAGTMGIMDILYIPADPSNYSGPEKRTGVKAVCLHHMAGVMSSEQCGRIFQTPNRGASAQYGIGVQGDIARYMDEKCVAWAVGNWPANCSTISIECSNSAIGGQWPVSDATIRSAIWLIADIARRNGLGRLIVGQTLTYHSMYSATQCPGPYMRSKMQFIADEANKLLGEDIMPGMDRLLEEGERG